MWGQRYHRKQESLLEEASRDVAQAEQDIRQGQLQRSMALVAGFAAIVSGFESYTQHQRGHFSNRLMWTPVWLMPLVVLASGAALFRKRAAQTVLPFVSLAALADGVIGFGYHLRGIARLPGGWKVGRYNIVMGPPIFAPLLMSSVGILGILASLFRREPIGGWAARAKKSPARQVSLRRRGDAQKRTRRARQAVRGLLAVRRRRWTRRAAQPDLKQEIAHGRFQQGMALISAVLAILAGGEAYFEHLRGSYNQRIMWTPVWVTPPMLGAAVGSIRSPQVAHRVLPFASLITFLDGLLGFFLHLRGVRRMPGGFSNIGFNITMGPPLFAPLLFTAVGLLGFIASLLRRE